MKRLLFPLFILVLMLPALACSFSVDLPNQETGTLETLDINEPKPNTTDPFRMVVEMGAGKLNIKDGADGLVSGQVIYNVPEWKPEINRLTNSVRLTQGGGSRIINLPNEKTVNEWNLQFGDHPLELEINAGAYQGTIDLSNIPIANLEISDGASQAEVRFDELNPVSMQEFSYKTGASQITLLGLSNANFEEMVFEGSTGTYTLDFSGTLQHDTTVRISSGVSNIKIILPENTPVDVSIEGGLNNVDAQGTWTMEDERYSRTGTGPKLTIKVEMALGNLELSVK